MKRLVFFLLLFLSLEAAAAPSAGLRPLPEYDLLFNTGSGWAGADGIISIPLSGQRILWLFGDTLVGNVSDGKRGKCLIINNSIAVQEGIEPGKARLKFHYPVSPDGNPAAFFRPPDEKSWFWPAQGLRTPRSLCIFLMQMEATGDSSVFGFRHIGSWLAVVKNPDESPEKWLVDYKKIPWATFMPGRNIFFGASVLVEGNEVYIYGISEESGKDNGSKAMVLARAPLASPERFGTWRFYAGGKWVRDFRDAGELCPGLATEYSVSHQMQQADSGRRHKSRQIQYMLITSGDAFSGEILVRTAPRPWGPWGKSRLIYRCPEIRGGKDIFCYAARAHPELSSDGNLIITYAANSTDFASLTDASLYRPRFLLLPLPGTGK